MTVPQAPRGFVLSEGWWNSGSAWHTKTSEDVREALDVGDAERDDGAAVVRGYYRDHPERLEFVPDAIKKEFGL